MCNAQELADAQAQKDVAMNEAVNEYLTSHIDVYPAALFMLATVLKAAIDAPSCGGSEPDALRNILKVVQDQVNKDDPMSLSLVVR